MPVGAGVRCNAVLPGLIRTPLVTGMLRAATPGISDAELASAFAERDAASPTGEMGRAEDVAKLVAYLLSDDAACAPLPLAPALASSALLARLGGLAWCLRLVLAFHRRCSCAPSDVNGQLIECDGGLANKAAL